MPQVLSSFKSVNVAAHNGKREDTRVVTVIPYNEHLAKAVERAPMPMQNKNIVVKKLKNILLRLPGRGWSSAWNRIPGTTWGNIREHIQDFHVWTGIPEWETRMQNVRDEPCTGIRDRIYHYILTSAKKVGRAERKEKKTPCSKSCTTSTIVAGHKKKSSAHRAAKMRLVACTWLTQCHCSLM